MSTVRVETLRPSMDERSINLWRVLWRSGWRKATFRAWLVCWTMLLRGPAKQSGTRFPRAVTPIAHPDPADGRDRRASFEGLGGTAYGSGKRARTTTTARYTRLIASAR